jgi:heavy metal-binding protein
MYNIIEKMKAAVLLAAAMGAALQTPVGSQADKLPPISYVCPMVQDAEVIEDKPGKCPKCGMELVPIRLDSVWTCPVHSVIKESKPGQCPIDHRDLVPVTMQLSWTCPGRPDSNSPGTCPDGTARAKKYSPRAHGNHNPQHGGQFFMAPDNWHHLEGAYLPNGVFRLYLYDDFTRPLPLAKVRGITARVVTKQTFDPATRTTKELTAVPLVRNGRYLEARVGALPLPAQMSAKVKFERAAPEHLFDFTFDAYSKDPGSAPRVTTAMPSAAPPVSTAAAAATPDPAPAPDPTTTAAVASGVDPALVPVPIPETVPEMLAQLRTRSDQIRTFIDRGSFASIYVPAFQAKDLALALDAHKDELPPERRKVAEPAIGRLVRSAYLLDAFGDIGNRQQIGEAYSMFTAAVTDIESAFPKR